MKKATAIVLAVVIFFCILPISAAETPPEYVYEINKKQTAAAISYITEMYIEKYPEFGLINEYGGEPDKQVLSDLARSLTKNCVTDVQRARVFYDWVRANIVYDEGYRGCSYPYDVYYEGRAVCHGFSMLYSRLLRLAGIPAVVFDGLRGDMKGTVTTENFFELRADYGHAWVMAYFDGAWRLFDTLWEEFDNTDRDYWNSWYFCTGIEGVAPYYDGTGVDLQGLDGVSEKLFGLYYVNGRSMTYYEGEPRSDVEIFSFMNGMTFHWIPKRQDPDGVNDGFDYVYAPGKRDAMINAQSYYDGFISNSGYMLFYADPNGIFRCGTTAQFEGNIYHLRSNGGGALAFSDCEKRQYMRGDPVVLVGETITVRQFSEFQTFEYEDDRPEYVYLLSENTENPESVTIHEDNTITVTAPGYVEIVCREEATNSTDFFSFNVLEAPRAHEYPAPDEGPISSSDEDAAVVNNGKKQVALLPGTDAAGIRSLLGDGVQVTGADGAPLDSDCPVGTGAVVTAADGTAFTVVVPGDIDGDGELRAADARHALRAAVGLETHEGVFAQASDIDGSGETQAADARQILRISVDLEAVTGENLKAAAA